MFMHCAFSLDVDNILVGETGHCQAGYGLCHLNITNTGVHCSMSEFTLATVRYDGRRPETFIDAPRRLGTGLAWGFRIFSNSAAHSTILFAHILRFSDKTPVMNFVIGPRLMQSCSSFTPRVLFLRPIRREIFVSALVLVVSTA